MIPIALPRSNHDIALQEDEEWMIDASEIEFEELIGTGGFGEVRKAVWRGTDVAVKTVASGHVTNDMRNAFIEEVFQLFLTAMALFFAILICIYLF